MPERVDFRRQATVCSRPIDSAYPLPCRIQRSGASPVNGRRSGEVMAGACVKQRVAWRAIAAAAAAAASTRRRPGRHSQVRVETGQALAIEGASAASGYSLFDLRVAFTRGPWELSASVGNVGRFARRRRRIRAEPARHRPLYRLLPRQAPPRGCCPAP